jgi:hypothetical protein
MPLVNEFVSYEGLDEDQVDCYQVCDCKVIQSFGPYVKGQKLPGVCFDFVLGKVHVYDNDDDFANGKASWVGSLALIISENFD